MCPERAELGRPCMGAPSGCVFPGPMGRLDLACVGFGSHSSLLVQGLLACAHGV